VTDRTQGLRALAFGTAGFIAASSSSWPMAIGAGLVVGGAGLVVERRLRGSFDAAVSFWATLALMTSGVFFNPSRTLDWPNLVLFGGSCLAFSVLAAKPSPAPAQLFLAAALALGPTAFEAARAPGWAAGPHHLLVALFGPDGLLYGAPLLWAGYLGLLGPRVETRGMRRLALAALVPGTLALFVEMETAHASTRAITWLPFLLPGLAHCFSKAREMAARHPERAIAAAGGLLILWNALFMEQYRRRQLPSDDTVSFARVTSNSAALLSRFVGTPAAWPANWIFASRFDTTADRWDAVAGHDLFADPRSSTATIEIGDDPTLFSKDAALLLEGFGDRRTCERGWCRDVDGAGRILIPVKSAGRGDFVIRIRLRGQGTIRISLNGAATTVSEMTEALGEVRLSVPARAVPAGIHVLSLTVDGGFRATLDRLTLERGL